MDELLASWYNILASAGIFDALDRGEAAVIHLLGDDADSFLQNAIPAYAVAVAACQEAGAAIGCEEKRVQLRDEGLTALLKATGLIRIIDLVIAEWRKIPPVLRNAAQAALQEGQDIKAVIDHPTFVTVWNLAVDSVEFYQKYGKALWNAAMTGATYVKAVAAWIGKYGDEANSVVANTLREVGLGAVADTVLAAQHNVAALIKAGAAHGSGSWQSVTSGNVASTTGAILEAPYTGPADVVSTVLSWF